MNKLYLALAIILLGTTVVTAQQDPHYTQYMYNMNVINPAYAGNADLAEPLQPLCPIKL